MLSIENPPDPTCSYKVSGLKNDERASQGLALQEADLVNSVHAESHFSIRDYVFTARTKDIETNWPFPQQYLQICLKHGVKDLLPPFEPPDSVRSWCCRKRIAPYQLVASANCDRGLAQVNSIDEENVSLLDGESDDVNYKSYQPSDQVVLGSSDRIQSPLLEDGKLTAEDRGEESSCRLSESLGLNEAGGGKIASTVTSHVGVEPNFVPSNKLPRPVHENNSSSEASIELEVAEPHISSDKAGDTGEPSDKNCRLIVKFGNISKLSQAEDSVLNSSPGLEPMASKVCPVCKTFTSTSNTTLNAHIDQCLSVESTTKRASTKLTKHRVKPRKIRSMVDICATAPTCTLEELDRRNGSNWAVGSSVQAPNGEDPVEHKRQRLGRVDVADDDEESAVYIDSNGTKVRILSKFNDTLGPAVGEDSRRHTHPNDNKEENKFSTGKKRRLAPKYSKYQKVKPQNNKLRTLKLYEGEICGAPEGNHHIENHEKEESLSQLLKARDQFRTNGSGNLRQWVCSKRTGVSRKMNGRDGHSGPDYPQPLTRNPLIESNQSNLSHSSMERNKIPKLPRSSENHVTSPRNKRMEIPSNTVHFTENGEKNSRTPSENNSDRVTGSSSSIADDGYTMKSISSLEKHLSSPSSKRVENQTTIVKNYVNIPKKSTKLSESRHPFLSKTKESSTSRKNVVLGRPSFLTSKKLRKRRSILETGKRVRELPSDANEGYDRIGDSTGILQPSSTGLTKLCGAHKLNRKNFSRSGTLEVLEARQEREAASISERQDPEILKRRQLASECYSPDPATIQSKFRSFLHQSEGTDVWQFKSDDQESAIEEVSVSSSTGIASSTEKAFGNPIMGLSETPTLEDQLSAKPFNIQSDSFPSLYEENTRPICGIEVPVEPMASRSYDEQEMHRSDGVSNEINRFNAQAAAEADARVVGGVSISGVVPTPIQEAEEHLQRPGEMGYKAHVENISIPSNRLLFTQDRHQPVDRDPSRSPVSETSTVSHSPMARTDFKYSVVESPERSVAGDKFGGRFSDLGRTFPSAGSIGGAERTNRENKKVMVITPAKEPAKYSDDQPCCCSRKDNVSRQSIVAATIVPTKEKQMTCNAYITGEISTSFSSCPSSRTDEIATPILESPTGSVSMKASDDAAKFTNCIDFSVASPSSQNHTQPASNPVLRLMGKNLMVVNKDEDESVKLPKVSMGGPNDYPNANHLTLLGYSMGNVPNKGHLPFFHQAPEGSMIFGQDPFSPMQNSNVGSPNSFRNPCYTRVCSTHQNPPWDHHDRHVGRFGGTVLQHGLKGRTDALTQEKRLNRKPNSQFPYNLERRVAHCQNQKPISAAHSGNFAHEVIVIDDSPELEMNSMSSVNTNLASGSSGNQPSPVGILPPKVLNPNPRPEKAFSYFPLQNTFTRELPGGPKPSFLMSHPGVNASSKKRGSASEGGLGRSHVIPQRPSGHLNPALYYSPGLL